MTQQEGKSFFFSLVGTPSAEPSLKHWLVARDLSSQWAQAALLSAVGVSISMTTMQSVSLLEDCYFRLLGGQVAIIVRRRTQGEDSDSAYQFWCGLQGNRSTQTCPAGRWTVEGRWHVTILDVRVPRPPGPSTTEAITAVAARLLENIGEIHIAGFVPRQVGSDVPRLFFVNVRSIGHDRLSSATNRMEQLLRVEHWRHRECYYFSQDEFEGSWKHED